jgi:cytidine deaminase
MDYQELVNEAFRARENAYAPYSHFAVGACALMRDHTMICGANVENAAYGSTMCAERNAIFQAYCQGYRQDDIVALAIVSDADVLISPCGACRQVLAELLHSDTPIILGCKEYYKITSIGELLPQAFTGECL